MELTQQEVSQIAGEQVLTNYVLQKKIAELPQKVAELTPKAEPEIE